MLIFGPHAVKFALIPLACFWVSVFHFHLPKQLKYNFFHNTSPYSWVFKCFYVLGVTVATISFVNDYLHGRLQNNTGDSRQQNKMLIKSLLCVLHIWLINYCMEYSLFISHIVCILHYTQKFLHIANLLHAEIFAMCKLLSTCSL